jgi:hypothetical protein
MKNKLMVFSILAFSILAITRPAHGCAVEPFRENSKDL